MNQSTHRSDTETRVSRERLENNLHENLEKEQTK